MKVPVYRSPNTRPVARQEGYVRGTPGIDLSPITNTIRQFATDLDNEHKKLEEFDLQRKFMEVTNARIRDYNEREQAQPLGAQGFTDRILTDYEAEDTALLDEFYDKGYSVEALHGMAQRLGSLRQQFGERALAFQGASTLRLGHQQFSQFATTLSQYTTENPDGYFSSKEELREAIDRFPVSEPEKADLFDRYWPVLREGAARGLSIQNPQLIIDALDPQGFTAPASAAGGGAYEIVEGLDADRSAVASTLSASLPAPVVAGFLGNFDVEGGYEGGQGDGGSASGIAQWRNERRTNFRNMFGKDPHEATKAEQAQFVLWEMDNPEQAGMTVEQRDEILAADNPQEAAELIDKYFERSSGEHRARRVEAAAGYSTIQTIDPGQSSAEQAPPLTVPEGADGSADAFDPLTAQTGNPILDDLTGPERIQALAWAREQQNRASVNIKGSFDVVIANAVAAVGDPRGYQGPTMTLEQAVQAYGPLEGPQKFAQFEQAIATNKVVQNIITLPPAQIAAQVEALRPDPTSPTYAVENQMYETAQRAQAHVMAQREADPAAYVFTAFPDIARDLSAAETTEQRQAIFARMDRAYEQLGITGGVGLTKDMLQDLGGQYATASAQGKMDIIESSLREMGPRMAGRTLGRAIGSPIVDDLRTYALLERHPGGRTIFLDIIRGKEAIAADPAKKPTQDTINNSYRGGLGDAIDHLGPDMSRVVNEAAVALYIQRGGSIARASGVATGFEDSALYTQALRDVLGGLAGNDKTGYADMTDSARVPEVTILPPQVTAGQFRAWQDGMTMARLQRLNPLHDTPRDRNMRPLSMQTIVDEGVFIMLAPGTYGIKLTSDGGWVLDKTGNHYLVDLSTLRPPR